MGSSERNVCIFLSISTDLVITASEEENESTDGFDRFDARMTQDASVSYKFAIALEL